MGNVKENLLTKGFSGKIGDEIVFRQVGNRTMFAKRPRKRTTFTPNQATQRTIFRDAVLFAKAALLDPATRAEYNDVAEAFSLRSAFNAAITDYLKHPEIALVYTNSYKGEVGNVIFILAKDAFKVKSATVTLQRADGTLIETGPAVAEQGQWKYIATQANDPVAGTRVIVNVKDRLGKETNDEKVLS
jgi:signal peptidase I